MLACDLVVAADDARFGLPEVKRGLVAAGGGLLRLSRRVPYHLAMEWALTGEFVSAAQAERVGLVNRLVPPGTALDDAVELAPRHRAQRPARRGGHQAHPDRVPRTGALDEEFDAAAGDQRAGARVGRRARGRAGVQGETHPAVDQHMSGLPEEHHDAVLHRPEAIRS